MTRWLVIGSGGFVGTQLRALLHDREVMAPNRADLDVTEAAAVSAYLQRVRPDVVVNCAGRKDLDAMEDDDLAAYAVNALGAGNVANACAGVGALLVQMSADYVFDGSATAPIPESSAARPISAYGRTKLAGEKIAQAAWERTLVVRSSWLFGLDGPCFVATMLRLERERETVSVVADQTGSPTWVRNLCENIVGLVDGDAKPGVYHCVDDGEATWFDLARTVFELAGADPARVLPVAGRDLNQKAARPRYSALSNTKAQEHVPPARHWRDTLTACLSAGGSQR